MEMGMRGGIQGVGGWGFRDEEWLKLEEDVDRVSMEEGLLDA